MVWEGSDAGLSAPEGTHVVREAKAKSALRAPILLSGLLVRTWDRNGEEYSALLLLNDCLGG